MRNRSWVFLVCGMIAFLCLLSFSYASYTEFSDPLIDFLDASPSDISPLSYSPSDSSWVVSGTNFGMVYNAGTGSYSLLASFTGDAALAGPINATVPLSGFTSILAQQVANNVSDIDFNILRILNQLDSGSDTLLYTLIHNIRDYTLDTSQTLSHFQDLVFGTLPGGLSSPSWIAGLSGQYSYTYQSIGHLLAAFQTAITRNQIMFSGEDFLSYDGSLATSSVNMNSSIISSQGFLGLASILRGESGSDISASFYTFDDDYMRDVESVQYANVLMALADGFSRLQKPLSQLQVILASDDDLTLRQESSEQLDAVDQDFFTDGKAAPSVSDIGDMGDLSSDMGTLFNSGVSAGSFFSSVNSSDAYSFFSQQTADDLDTTNSISAFSTDDPFEDFVLDEDGYYQISDTSFFDLWSFLGKED